MKRLKTSNLMPSPRNISREDAEEAWPSVLSRAFQMFAYYHWWTFVQLHPDVSNDPSSIVLSNAALESSLMSIRDLDDFFCSRPKFADDLVASDYGFPSARNYLSKDEREAINKKLTHLTYRSVHELRDDPMCKNPRTWNNADLVNRAMTRWLEFMGHLEFSFFDKDPLQQKLIQTARRTIQLSLANIDKIARNEMDFRA